MTKEIADDVSKAQDKLIAAMQEIGQRDYSDDPIGVSGGPRDLTELALTTGAEILTLVGRLSLEVHQLRAKVAAAGL